MGPVAVVTAIIKPAGNRSRETKQRPAPPIAWTPCGAPGHSKRQRPEPVNRPSHSGSHKRDHPRGQPGLPGAPGIAAWTGAGLGRRRASQIPSPEPGGCKLWGGCLQKAQWHPRGGGEGAARAGQLAAPHLPLPASRPVPRPRSFCPGFASPTLACSVPLPTSQGDFLGVWQERQERHSHLVRR